MPKRRELRMESASTTWSLLLIVSVVWIGYVVAGYPLLAILLGRMARRAAPVSGPETVPFVSVVIAAHNEVRAIEARLHDVFASGHPRERLEVIVASDGSSDGTETICGAVFGDAVVLLRSLQRVGKTKMLDEAVQYAKGDLLVFTDATTRFRPGTMQSLLAPFNDPLVGCSAGRLAYAHRRADGAGLHDTFRSIEDLVRSSEAAFGYVPSVSGALHAMRRDLYRSARADATRDLLDPAQVVALGRRVAFDPDCVADEIGPTTAAESIRSRARMTLRGLTALPTALVMLTGAGRWVAVWQLVSHKLLRWLLWIPAGLAWLSHFAIALVDPAWVLLFVLHSALWAASVTGALLAVRGVGGGVASAIGFPVLTLVPMALATIDWCRGRRAALWQTDRASDPS
jgi:cellulose synthase/poly-beta-1,6-N-acetylglucosamine synthase-like glycosyltransferase